MSILQPGGEVTPAVVFGFPNVDIAAVDGEAVAIPFCVRADRMSICSGDLSGIAWARRPDHFWYDVFFILVTFKMPSSSPLPCAVLLIPAQGFRDGREGFRGGREGFVGMEEKGLGVKEKGFVGMEEKGIGVKEKGFVGMEEKSLGVKEKGFVGMEGKGLGMEEKGFRDGGEESSRVLW